MKTNKNTSKIILSIIVAALATMISYSGFKKMNSQLSEQQQLIQLMQNTKAKQNKENYAYAVALNGLKAGEIVADSDIDVKPFDAENPDAFDNRADVVNKVLLKDIQSGEVFTSQHIAKISNDNVSVRPGYRALSLPAESFQGKSNSMTPGSSVDIYSASGDNDWVLENIRLLSFESGQKVAGAEPTITSANSITFEVPTDSISDFITSVSKNRLVLVARDPNDKRIVHRYHKTDYSANSAPLLPNLPASVPIQNLGPSGLPQPIMPVSLQPSVEVIEANVKSKVTFD